MTQNSQCCEFQLRPSCRVSNRDACEKWSKTKMDTRALRWRNRACRIAIFLGLCLVSSAWADWPMNEKCGKTDGQCKQEKGSCPEWPDKGTCVDSDTEGWDQQWFTCVPNGSIYLSLKITDNAPWGYCTGTAGTCEVCQVTFCVELKIYSEPCNPQAGYQCTIYGFADTVEQICVP